MRCLKCLRKFEQDDKIHYGLHLECFCTWFALSEIADFSSLTRRPDPFLDQNMSFFHGVFKKYSAELARSSYILKMRDSETAPQLPEVEYLCNQIGRHLGIPVAEFYMIDFHGDQAFVTKNFIEPGEPVNLQHIYHFVSKAEHSCQNLIKIVMEQTKSLYDLAVLLQTILFDALIGNPDRHGRNFAFIVTAKSTRLSPVYDNVSDLVLWDESMLAADINPLGKISTNLTSEPSMKDYVKELKNLGCGDAVQKFYKKIKLDELNKLIENSFCNQAMKLAIKKLIYKRYQELENGLKA